MPHGLHVFVYCPAKLRDFVALNGTLLSLHDGSLYVPNRTPFWAPVPSVAVPVICPPLSCGAPSNVPFLNIRLARDSARTQTGQTQIVSCDRLVSTTIYALWGPQ
jgi:hypothetical protein